MKPLSLFSGSPPSIQTDTKRRVSYISRPLLDPDFFPSYHGSGKKRLFSGGREKTKFTKKKFCPRFDPPLLAYRDFAKAFQEKCRNSSGAKGRAGIKGWFDTSVFIFFPPIHDCGFFFFLLFLLREMSRNVGGLYLTRSPAPANL